MIGANTRQQTDGCGLHIRHSFYLFYEEILDVFFSFYQQLKYMLCS
jgi:hypothetical protein